MHKYNELWCAVVLATVSCVNMSAMQSCFPAEKICALFADEESSGWQWDEICDDAKKEKTEQLARDIPLLPVCPQHYAVWQRAQQDMGVAHDSCMPAFVLPSFPAMEHHFYLFPPDQRYAYINTTLLQKVPYGVAWFGLCKGIVRKKQGFIATLALGDTDDECARCLSSATKSVELEVVEKCACWRCLYEVMCDRTKHEDAHAGDVPAYAVMDMVCLSRYSPDVHFLISGVAAGLIDAFGFDANGSLRAWILRCIVQKLRQQSLVCDYHRRMA